MSSPIEKLKEQIQKSLVFDNDAAFACFEEYAKTWENLRPVFCEEYIEGMKSQHEKSAQMASQLLEAIEVLEFYAVMRHPVYQDRAAKFLAKLSKGSEK